MSRKKKNNKPWLQTEIDDYRKEHSSSTLKQWTTNSTTSGYEVPFNFGYIDFHFDGGRQSGKTGISKQAFLETWHQWRGGFRN